MQDVFKILPEATEDQKVFIFDYGKKENGELKYKDDITSYEWNTKRFNKVEVGAFILSRIPGKNTKDRKFEIYGGGYVEKIETIDDKGNVVATISHAFTINPPIKQGEALIENFVWENKKKKEGTWEHFWNQYGMNTITFSDFKNLMKNVRCVPVGTPLNSFRDSDLLEEEIEELQNPSSKDFEIICKKNDAVDNKKDKQTVKIIKKIDWKKVQDSKDKIGALGEEIVFDILTQEAEKNNLKKPIHVSKEEGDGVGYDIRAWDKDDKELHIEVKASKRNYSDGFEITRNEIEASKNKDYPYIIYRVYNLDIKNKNCSIEIYSGPVTDETFKLEPTKFIVYKK